MEIGAIIAAPSIDAPRRVTPVAIPLLTMERTPILPVRGVSILTPSIGAQKLVPAAARQTMTMPITVIPTEAGQKPMICSISAQKPARFVKLPVKNTPIM